MTVLCCSGKSFLEYIDELPSLTRSIDGPLRIPISERYKVRTIKFLLCYSAFVVLSEDCLKRSCKEHINCMKSVVCFIKQALSDLFDSICCSNNILFCT